MLRASLIALTLALTSGVKSGLKSGHGVSLYMENLGNADLGVFFAGDSSIDRPFTVRDYTYERLIDKIPSDNWVMHDTFVGHSFIIRSNDFQTRIKVQARSLTPRYCLGRCTTTVATEPLLAAGAHFKG